LGIRPDKVSVIPNGVDERFAPRTPEEIEAVRRALGINATDYILCVGSLEPRKNLRRLIEAWAKIPPMLGADVELVIAGARGSSRVFDSVGLDPLPPRVHFTGYVSDEQLPALYSGALALVYPSLYEGFGLPPLEAMACGTPVVTSSGTSLAEVAANVAVMVDPEDVDSIAHGIRRVVSSSALREELRRRGLERASQNTWERTARQTLDLLLEQAKS
jgi:glycosyltransferase involved in cell wall biosynthesis